jgi:rhodanese-related sulfurtransferase
MAGKDANFVATVDPAAARRWLEAGEAVLVDVREPFEHAAAHIEGSQLLPLTSFKPEQVPDPQGKKIVVHCKGGGRSRQAAAMLAAAGRREVYSLSGGLEAWRGAGLPVAGSGRRVIDAQRQVFIVVGCMILLGLALGAWVDSRWLVLPLLAGLGLLNAGLTGFCPLLVVIARAPWNRSAACCAAGS